MTSEEGVYNALKYRVVVEPNGTRKYFNAAGQLHHDEGPAQMGPLQCTVTGQQNGGFTVWPTHTPTFSRSLH